MNDYIQQAQRTTPSDLSPVRQRLAQPPVLGALGIVTANVVGHSQALDALKKHIFYGKSIDGDLPPVEMNEATEKDFERIKGLLEDDNLIKLIHAYIGIITEAGELANAICLHLFSGQDVPLDKTNITEEIGDSQWYHAEAAAALGIDFAEIQRINIAKLTARFPQKFTEHHAENRDLVNERNVLEAK